MLFWLKKAATLPFLPLYFTLLVGLAGLLALAVARRRRGGIILISIAFGVLLTFSNEAVATVLLRRLQQKYPAIPEAHNVAELRQDVAECTAIVVLGGGHADAPSRARVNQLSSASMSRIGEAVRLSRLLPHAKFIVSGHHIEGLSHAQVLGEAAVSLGVDPARIVRMDDPRDTEDEINDLFERVGKSPVALVTSAWHMPRAIQLCRAIGVNAVPCPADFMMDSGEDGRLHFFGWNLESLEGSTKAIRENLGALWLKLRGK